jgi:hypothetical protein
MSEFLNIFNYIAAIITIIATTISIILWVKYRERDKWVYSSFLSILEGLNRLEIFTKLGPKDNRLLRVSDRLVTIRDNVVASMKTIDPKRTHRPLKKLEIWI